MGLPKDGDFAGLVAEGENPNGFVAQTANGTRRDGFADDGRTYQWGTPPDGARWNFNPMPGAEPEMPAMAATVVSVTAHTRRRPR